MASITYIMILLTSHICTRTDPFDLLILDFVLLNIPMVCVYLCSFVWRLSTPLCSTEFVSVNISSRHPVPFPVCSLRFSLAVIGVFLMCLVFHVISLLVFVTLTMYDCSLWFAPLSLYNHSINPLSSILLLHSYCRPYRKRNWVFVSIIALQSFILL